MMNQWKLIAIGTGIALVTAVVTGVVVASWPNHGATQAPADVAAPRVEGRMASRGEPMPAGPGAPTARTGAHPARPSAADVAACNQYAQAQARNATGDTIKDALIGDAVGAGVGAAAGTLFGLSDANQRDARAVQAYQACMRSRGFVG